MKTVITPPVWVRVLRVPIFLTYLTILYGLLAGPVSGSLNAHPVPNLTKAAAPAQGYQYVRFVLEDNASGVRFFDLDFLNGSVTYPKLIMESNKGTPEATLIDPPREAYLLFDNEAQTGPYLKDETDGESEVTLQFDYPVYLTGVRLTKISWATINSFRVEATNDLSAGWTLLYDAPDNLDNSYFDNDEVGTFDFGTDPVSVDTTPPTTPNVSADEVTQNSAVVSWPAAGASSYQVLIDGVSQGFTTENSFSTSYTLEPSTTYQVSVVAYDAQYNASPAGTLNIETQGEQIAQGYRYLRFWIDDISGDKVTLKEVNWLMGDRNLPLSAIISPDGNERVEVLSTTANLNSFDPPYKVYDDQTDTHWYTEANQEATLHFKDVTVYPTGIELIQSPYTVITSFRCQGSNDGSNWTTLYEQSNLTSDSYPATLGPDGRPTFRSNTFSFDLQLPGDIDQAPPSVPSSLTAAETMATFVQISWDASSDAGVGVSAYRIEVESNEWIYTTDTEATIYALSPGTTYSVTVTAIDQLGNESAPSGTLTVNTPSLETAVGSMDVGTGLGSRTEDIYKENVDFAAEWASYATANPFSSDYIEELSHYQVMRFMNMVPINSNEIKVWADRRQPDAPDQRPNTFEQEGVIYQGMAYEWMIKLCNLTGSDFWAPVPHRADDAYVRNLANLVKEHLDPSLNVYLEYSNEVWNNDPNRARWFTQSDYATEKGQELGLDQGSFPRYGNFFEQANYARYRYYVYRSLEMYDIFNDVFANQSNRVVKVLSGWAGQPNMTRVHLDALADASINPKGIYPDRYAIAPYFGLNKLGASDNLDLDTNPIATLRAAIAGTVSDVRQHYEILAESSLALPLISYEAGQHLTKSGQLYSRQPYMYQMYIEYMNQLAPYLTLFTHFVHVGGYSRGNAWGSKEYVGQPALKAYKYRAIKDWQRVNRNNGSVDAPFILEQPEQVEVSEGGGVALEPVIVGQRPLSFQWYKGGTLLPDETGSTLFLHQVDKNAVLSFVVTNSFGQASSDPINLTVVAVEKVSVAKATGSVTVDGQVDAAWDAATSYSLENVNAGEVSNNSDLSASFKTLWDDQYLYVLVDVTDNTLVPTEDPEKPWKDDAVEIYIDATNDKTTSYNGNDRQIIYGYQNDGLVAVSGTMSIDKALASQVSTDQGYRVEIALFWADMNVTPQGGDYLGLDVMVNDNDTPSGQRDGKLAWWATEDLSWREPIRFGTALLEGTDSETPPSSSAFPVASTPYRLRHVQTGRFLDTGSNGKLSTKPADDGGTDRVFRFVAKANSSTYWIVNGKGGRGALDTGSDGLVKWVSGPNPTGADKQWAIAEAGNNQYYIRNQQAGRGWLAAGPNGGVFWTNNQSAATVWEPITGANNARTAHNNEKSLSADPTFAEEVLVFPNPAQDILHLRLPARDGEVTITLTDMLGRQVLEHHQLGTEQVDLPVQNLTKGLYQMSVELAGQRTMRKVLVE